jgi:SH3-like domain-containing protein
MEIQRAGRDRTRGGRAALELLTTLALCALGGAGAGAADGTMTGTATGLPVPRYVSLKSDRVNLREGPSRDHRTQWVFQRAGLPVEVTAEFEIWRRIRDSEGAEGWVLHSLLSGRRTVLVSPWSKTGTLPLYDSASTSATVIAQLQPGVIGNVKSCDGTWCRIAGSGFDGYLQQDKLWGAYPNEKVD